MTLNLNQNFDVKNSFVHLYLIYLCFVVKKRKEKDRLGGVVIPLYKAMSTISLSLQLNLQVSEGTPHPPTHPLPLFSSLLSTPFRSHLQHLSFFIPNYHHNTTTFISFSLLLLSPDYIYYYSHPSLKNFTHFNSTISLSRI